MSSDFFKGFSEAVIAGDGADIFVRTGGSGPPLLLLHGYPQSHVMWHPVAEQLAAEFSVVAADLRGYGHSSCPQNDAGNQAYSKRAMARDMLKVMSALGHRSFAVAGHDRGGRVAYRMALDAPGSVTRLAVLDIVSTEDTWQAFDPEFAISTYHWPFLAQPHPLPETLIAADPVFYLDWTIASWCGSGDLRSMHRDALAAYRQAFSDPARVHATCNDYRAGATYDRMADRKDLAAGAQIKCPVLALWGQHGIPAKTDRSPAEAWQKWCAQPVTGKPVAAGHFLVEENPGETLSALLAFFGGPRQA